MGKSHRSFCAYWIAAAKTHWNSMTTGRVRQVVCLFLMVVSVLPTAVVLGQGDVTKGGCDLAFLPGAAPTVNGGLGAGEWTDAGQMVSGGCIGALAEGTSLGTISSSLPAHQVVIYTKRDSTAFYLALDVNDATSTTPTFFGEKIQILLDPNRVGGMVPTTGMFRLDFTTLRATSGDAPEWYVGKGIVADPWNGPQPLPAGVVVARQNRTTPTVGYSVEVKIPFAAVGYTLGGSTGAIKDIGISLAIFNDNGFQDVGAEVFTATQFPDTTTLKITNAMTTTNTPDVTTIPAWNQPKNWASGFLTGAGDSIFFDPTPYWWMSQDIKAGFCNATSFVDAGDPFTATAKWYKYNPPAPCDMRLWGRVHRKGAGVGDVGRRILFLWAEHGANPQKWYFIGLTDPLTVPVPPSEAISPRMVWNGASIPANKPTHPCIRAFILPTNLTRPGFDEAFFQGIGNGDGLTNESKIASFVSAYGLTNEQIVQMNIERLTTPFTCPACIGKQGDWSPFVTTAFAATETVEVAQLTPAVGTSDRKQVVDPLVALEAYGIVPSSAPKKYVIVEAMGGVMKVIGRDYIKEHPKVRLAMNVSNSADHPRRLFVNSVMRFPADLKDYRVEVDQPEGVFNPGETRPVVSKATTEPPSPACSNFLSCCFDKVTRTAGLGLAVGLVGVGAMAYRRRKSFSGGMH